MMLFFPSAVAQLFIQKDTPSLSLQKINMYSKVQEHRGAIKQLASYESMRHNAWRYNMIETVEVVSTDCALPSWHSRQSKRKSQRHPQEFVFDLPRQNSMTLTSVPVLIFLTTIFTHSSQSFFFYFSLLQLFLENIVYLFVVCERNVLTYGKRVMFEKVWFWSFHKCALAYKDFK